MNIVAQRSDLVIYHIIRMSDLARAHRKSSRKCAFNGQKYLPRKTAEKTLKNYPRTVPGLPWEAFWGDIGALLRALGGLLERSWTLLGHTLDAQNRKSWLKAGSEG